MNLFGWATLLLSTIALGSVLFLEGHLGTGILAGVLTGGGLALAGIRLQRAVLETRPERSLHAFSLAFLAKLLALVLGGLLLRFVEPLAALADWRAFLLSYSGAVALLLPLGYHAVVTRWLAGPRACASEGGPK